MEDNSQVRSAFLLSVLKNHPNRGLWSVCTITSVWKLDGGLHNILFKLIKMRFTNNISSLTLSISIVMKPLWMWHANFWGLLMWWVSPICFVCSRVRALKLIILLYFHAYYCNNIPLSPLWGTDGCSSHDSGDTRPPCMPCPFRLFSSCMLGLYVACGPYLSYKNDPSCGMFNQFGWCRPVFFLWPWKISHLITICLFRFYFMWAVWRPLIWIFLHNYCL